MCEGGVVDGRVFSKVTDNVIILKNGTAPKSYKDICPVTKTIMLRNLACYNFILGSAFLHHHMDGR